MKTVAIIGGGPAGAMAAEKLAQGHATGGGACGRSPSRTEEFRVRIFEGRLGWEKPCGGALSSKALRRYPFLLASWGQAKAVREMEIVAPNGSGVRFHLRRPLAIYSRAVLNDLLLRRAEAAGVAVLPERILHFRRLGRGWELQGRHGTYTADYLVLAAGARSRLRSLLVEDFAARDFMLTFGYYLPGEDALARVQFFEDFEGYAWAFPRPDHLSVGICGKAGRERMESLRERLHGFMKTFGYSRDSTAIYSHLLPALSVEGWSAMRLAGPGWALAGDAAGLVDPITGEGIYYALRSGELLAESLLAGAPQTYPEKVRREFGRVMALGARLAAMFYRGEFLGAPVTTRMVEFAARSETFLTLTQDLIDGSQMYRGLAWRLYRGLPRALAEMAVGALRRPPLSGSSDWTQSHAH